MYFIHKLHKQIAYFLSNPFVDDGMIELMKWVGLVLMTLDHTNKFVFDSGFPLMSDAGRLAFPLFACVLAYNLSRPGLYEREHYQSIIKRLLIFGIAATPFFYLLIGPWPLNILFTLCLATVIVRLWIQRNDWAILVFLIGGSLVEYVWIGLWVTVSAYWFFKEKSTNWFLCFIASLITLCVINQNIYALLVIPILFMASRIRISVSRSKWAFYTFYPVHLAVIWVIS